MSHWINVSWTLHITIHQDKPRYKITYMYILELDASCMTTLQDTIRIHHDTCILDACRAGYTKDTLEIHCEYIQDTYPGLVLSALLPKELKSLRLFVALESGSTWGSR